jgi:hypothetical protein
MVTLITTTFFSQLHMLVTPPPPQLFAAPQASAYLLGNNRTYLKNTYGNQINFNVGKEG